MCRQKNNLHRTHFFGLTISFFSPSVDQVWCRRVCRVLFCPSLVYLPSLLGYVGYVGICLYSVADQFYSTCVLHMSMPRQRRAVIYIYISTPVPVYSALLGRPAMVWLMYLSPCLDLDGNHWPSVRVSLTNVGRVYRTHRCLYVSTLPRPTNQTTPSPPFGQVQHRVKKVLCLCT